MKENGPIRSAGRFSLEPDVTNGEPHRQAPMVAVVFCHLGDTSVGSGDSFIRFARFAVAVRQLVFILCEPNGARTSGLGADLQRLRGLRAVAN